MRQLLGLILKCVFSAFYAVRMQSVGRSRSKSLFICLSYYYLFFIFYYSFISTFFSVRNLHKLYENVRYANFSSFVLLCMILIRSNLRFPLQSS